MARYAVYLHVDLFDAMPRGSQRRKMMEFIRTLQAQPNPPGDYTESDEDQRAVRTKIVGNYAVSYWLDDPARAVIVTKIQPAG